MTRYPKINEEQWAEFQMSMIHDASALVEKIYNGTMYQKQSETAKLALYFEMILNAQKIIIERTHEIIKEKESEEHERLISSLGPGVREKLEEWNNTK